MRATICVDVTEDGQLEAVDAWFERWRPRLDVVSENQGCGCCVHIWDVDGPADAIAELPDAVKALSEWTNVT